ncbi:hypothetical protein [Anaerotignum neopropionicum]|uniref:hypothetical protein n=1 Tax=Anaerotignum neopropionicum TaxID=36847 RepID=UPI0012FE5B74|nr:hypothetical protein [Anaerotignum neopropionicum]
MAPKACHQSAYFLPWKNAFSHAPHPIAAIKIYNIIFSWTFTNFVSFKNTNCTFLFHQFNLWPFFPA